MAWVEHLTSLPKRGVGAISTVSAFRAPTSGADPEIEKGGGHTYRVEPMRVLASFPGLRAFITCSTSLKPENEATYIEHVQSCSGSGGMLPQENFKI